MPVKALMSQFLKFILHLGLLVIFTWVPVANTAPRLENQLANHASPYLALHANDPVKWQDWKPAVIKRARKQNKLVYLSIGYFSCHWCHVMQRESYQNPEIAKFLNENFIPVKVDRELEPALDARLIEFAEQTQGVAGWPLNVFLTPEGYPLYVVLYMPPKEFQQVLVKLQKLWQQDPISLTKLARQAVNKGEGPGKPDLDASQVNAYVGKIVETSFTIGDPFHGGFGEQSKFPSVPQLDFLLAQYQRQPDSKLKIFLQRTLDQMMRNGLYDHLGGGFFRYTVDPGWQTPHFEKMLYDNALLARLYLHAGKLWHRDDYLQIATQTLKFMQQEMRHTDGAFIASLSALDDKGVEGGYYLWSLPELKKYLSVDELKVYRLASGMMDAPPFDNGYLPMQALTEEEVGELLKFRADKVKALFLTAQSKLRIARHGRTIPKDRKVLAGWNGLALSAYAEAARVRKDPDYKATATAVRNHLVNVLWIDRSLHRSMDDGRSIGQSSLEDYAQVARGLLDYARLTKRQEDYRMARQVVDAAWERFYSGNGWRLSERTLMQSEAPRDAHTDGPMPSPSGSILATSLALAKQGNDHAFLKKVLATLNSGHEDIQSDTFWYATHVAAMAQAVNPGY